MPMFTYNLWMRCLQPDIMSISLSSYQHCDEQQFQTLSSALYTIVPVLKLDLVLQALLLDYIIAQGKYTRTPCVHLVFIKKSIFLNIFKTKYTTKTTSVSYSVLLEACPQPCCKRSMQIDTILYYCFYIKEVHFEMF